MSEETKVVSSAPEVQEAEKDLKKYEKVLG